jgi:hypothetical protein
MATWTAATCAQVAVNRHSAMATSASGWHRRGCGDGVIQDEIEECEDLDMVDDDT